MVHLKSSLNRIPQQDILVASRRQASAQAAAKPAPSSSSSAQNSKNQASPSNSTAASFQALFSAQTESASQQSATRSTTPQAAGVLADTPAPDSAPTLQSVFGSSSPWLSDPTGTSPDGTTFDYNPEYFATSQAAAQVAAMLGGKVVEQNQFAPNGSPFGQSASNEMVQMPDGGLVNAGLVAAFFTHGYPQSVVDAMIANTIANT